MVLFAVTISVTSLESVEIRRVSRHETAPFGKDWPGTEIVCFLAAAAGVAAVQTFVTGPRSDHYHAARVAGGRV